MLTHTPNTEPDNANYADEHETKTKNIKRASTNATPGIPFSIPTAIIECITRHHKIGYERLTHPRNASFLTSLVYTYDNDQNKNNLVIPEPWIHEEYNINDWVTNPSIIHIALPRKGEPTPFSLQQITEHLKKVTAEKKIII